MNEDQLRDIDHVILQNIAEGQDDTQKITEATILETHQVRYSLKKLQDLGLVDLTKPDGMVERIVEGQKRVFKAPLQAELIDTGHQCLKKADRADFEEYENLTQQELVKRVHRLERQVQRLEQSLNVFKQQTQRKL